MKEKIQISIQTSTGSEVSDSAFLDRETGEIYLSTAFETQLTQLGVDLTVAVATVQVGSRTVPVATRKPVVEPGQFRLDLNKVDLSASEGADRFFMSFSTWNVAQQDMFAKWLQSLSVAATGGTIVYMHSVAQWTIQAKVNAVALGLAAVVCLIAGMLVVKGE